MQHNQSSCIVSKFKEISLNQVQLESLEKDILDANNIIFGRDILVKNIKVCMPGQTDEINWIHTYISLDPKQPRQIKPVIVIIHQFGCSSLAYCKMFKQLREHFQIYCIDLLGMGLSSRPDVTHLCTPKEALEYLIYSIEQWVTQIGLQNQQFYLLGYSFGGYIASFYALKNQHAVKKLFLLCSVGICNIDIQDNEQYKRDKLKMLNWRDSIAYSIIEECWKDKIPFEELSKKWFFPTEFIINHLFLPQLNLPLSHEVMWKKFMVKLISQPASSSTLIYKLFLFPGIISHFSIELHFKRLLSIPVHFIFAEKDWVRQEGARRLCLHNKNQFTMEVIPDATHMVGFEKSKEIVESIVANSVRQAHIEYDPQRQGSNIQQHLQDQFVLLQKYLQQEEKPEINLCSHTSDNRFIQLAYDWQ